MHTPRQTFFSNPMRTINHWRNQMNKISRRSVLTKAMPAAVLAVAVPRGAKADQPHMEAALEALRKAKTQLEEATPDKGGHRAKAIKHVNQAIGEVEAGIRFDRRH